MPKPRDIRAAAAAAAAIAAATAAQLCLVNTVRACDPVTSYRNERCDGKRVVDGVAEQSPVRELHCLQEKHTHADERAAPIHALDTEERLGHHYRTHVQQLQPRPGESRADCNEASPTLRRTRTRVFLLTLCKTGTQQRSE